MTLLCDRAYPQGTGCEILMNGFLNRKVEQNYHHCEIQKYHYVVKSSLSEQKAVRENGKNIHLHEYPSQ